MKKCIMFLSISYFNDRVRSFLAPIQISLKKIGEVDIQEIKNVNKQTIDLVFKNCNLSTMSDGSWLHPGRELVESGGRICKKLIVWLRGRRNHSHPPGELWAACRRTPSLSERPGRTRRTVAPDPRNTCGAAPPSYCSTYHRNTGRIADSDAAGRHEAQSDLLPAGKRLSVWRFDWTKNET